MSPQIEIQLIAVLTAAACVLPGQFLVLRKMSMISDSITHTILLGIVLGFFVTQDLSSPLLILGAGLVGVLTVWLTEIIEKTKLVSEDAAIGLVFPLLFSVAVILISRYAGSAHLDTDSVLLGELAFAPFDRLVIFGRDIGAKGIYLSGVLVLLNGGFILLFFKELKLTTFDPVLAAVIGFSPAVLHYGLMGLVSVTAVGAFQAVGSVLVVAFMIGPPVTAYLLTDDLKKMILISLGLSVIDAVAGYQLASLFDISIAGSMAAVVGIIFILVFIMAPEYGILRTIIRRKKQRYMFAAYTFMLHLYHHADTEKESDENGVESVQSHLNWKKGYTRKVAEQLKKEAYITETEHIYCLTKKGREASLAFDREVLGL